MDNDCDGCCILNPKEECCYSKIDGCPCKHCLVKTMCEKPCVDFAIHQYNTDKLRRQRRLIMSDSICDGCAAEKLWGRGCRNVVTVVDCPCGNCLVKGMCVDTCADYNEWLFESKDKT